MIKRYQNLANLGIGLGLILSIGGRIVVASQMPTPPATTAGSPAIILAAGIASLIGTAAFIYGCVMYALAKGRNGAWGAFGLLSIIGLIVLVCLKDHAREGEVTQPRGFAVEPSRNPPPMNR